jgi:hypothetical protein
MVIFLPGFDFLLPDTIFLYRRRTMGMIWFFRLMRFKYNIYKINYFIVFIIYIIYIIILPFNRGIFGGGKVRNFWEIFYLTTWNIPPPHFWGFLRMWGGPPDVIF